MAVAAGVLEPDVYPEELCYARSTKQWHIKH